MDNMGGAVCVCVRAPPGLGYGVCVRAPPGLGYGATPHSAAAAALPRMAGRAWRGGGGGARTSVP
eukprot:361453-Chlamydomonas_euryale.AAC.1